MRNQQVFDAIGRKLAKDFPTKPALVLDPELRIRAVTSAYADATLCERGELLGQFMFDAFPDDPSDPLASGTANLAASFETAMSTRRDHDM